jgi:hypothetical protein
LNEAEFSRAARAAFEVYRDDQSRTFPLWQFREFAGADATDKMFAAGILCGEEEATYMSHHLHHDYLASRHLVTEPMTWNRDDFDVLTFSASSFDAVAMAIEQITDSTRADLFVRKLYDWNVYSAAYSVAEAMQGRSYVSEQMLCIMLAVLAERRWDIIKATAQRAEDALRLFPSAIHRPFAQAANLEEVFRLVEARDYGQREFVVWRTLFIKRSTERAEGKDIELISNDDSVIGWTVANVLKRCKISSVQQARLREISGTGSPTVRWRVVHALGSRPGSTNFNYLVKVIESDPDGWVRYGAVRSLVEMAASGSVSLRARIFAALRNRVSRVLLDKKVQGELRRVLFIRRERAPSDWATLALGLMACLFESATTPRERTLLEQQALDFKREYELTNYDGQGGQPY